ncbi:lycopene cyclase domain-containing protein [Candidatus Micrarchaeota archaeon]|nr:lycopene cyclase domain-containing protein [Candidatus Micrarchaeota archaeon]
MSVEYAAYLAFVLLGTLALAHVFRLRLDVRRLLMALVPVAVLFVAWDAWAVASGHWSFDARFITGFFVGNQPVEEIAFFLVVPLFYVAVWEISKGKAPGSHMRKQGGERR